MIKTVQGTKVGLTCQHCERDFEVDLSGAVLEFLPEFNEYENLPIQCECGALEVFNMNIPENDTDEPFKTGQIPINEEIQRHHIRLIQRMIRIDFVDNK